MERISFVILFMREVVRNVPVPTVNKPGLLPRMCSPTTITTWLKVSTTRGVTNTIERRFSRRIDSKFETSDPERLVRSVGCLDESDKSSGVDASLMSGPRIMRRNVVKS